MPRLPAGIKPRVIERLTCVDADYLLEKIGNSDAYYYPDIVENEIVFMHKDIQTHPIVSLVLDNLNSLMIITNEGIKEVI